MKSLPLSMVETWVFLAQSSDLKLAHAKFRAYQKIKMQFGQTDQQEARVLIRYFLPLYSLYPIAGSHIT